MNRRSFGLGALFASALLVGTIAGSASASQSPNVGPPARKAPPVQCKTTKECPQDYVCTKVNDHKECTPTAIKVPTSPVVT